MGFQRFGLSLAGAVLVVALVLAGGTVWLFLTNPAPVVKAMNEGDVTPFVRDLARVLLDALQGLLKYL
jgi:hypothetical protein